jgi:hypothetical protein
MCIFKDSFKREWGKAVPITTVKLALKFNPGKQEINLLSAGNQVMVIINTTIFLVVMQCSLVEAY